MELLRPLSDPAFGTQSVAYTGTAGSVTGWPAGPQGVLVWCTSDAYIRVGNGVTATSADTPLPANTPALYSLMNYADIEGGTWFPEKGMYQIVKGMYNLAVELGVTFHFNEEVTSIEVTNGLATALQTQLIHSTETTNGLHTADVIIGGADYHHIETALLPAASRSYSEAYWNSRVMAPGCLLYYVGIQKKLTGVQHQSLFFDTSFA